MLKFSPILFSTPMVQSIIAGNKTKTRRTIKPQPIEDSGSGYVFDGKHKSLYKNDIHHQDWRIRFIEDWSKYKVGGVLWVRETFVPVLAWSDGKQLEDPQFAYRADSNFGYGEAGFKWKPGIHMPKSACRLFLKIKSVNIERLHEISEEDCISEGLESKLVQSKVFQDFIGYRNYFRQDIECPEFFRSPYQSFQSLWMKINGFDSWDLNPYVWVIEFEKIDKPENFL